MDKDETTPRNGRMIKDIEAQLRPREKAMQRGFKDLSNAELLALIFSTGIRGKSVIELSEEILHDNKGHLSKLTSLSVAEICRRYKGIGQAKAINLLAALEIGARSASDAMKLERTVISDPDVAYTVMYPHFLHLTHEEFWVIYVNRRGEIIRESRIGQGGTSSTTVDVKIIMQGAIETLCEGIMLFHNHPSGNLQPSSQDRGLTNKIKQACELFSITLLDHLIVTDRDYFSFKCNDLL